VTIGSCRKQREARKGLPLCITAGVLAQHSACPPAARLPPPLLRSTSSGSRIIKPWRSCSASSSSLCKCARSWASGLASGSS